MFNPGLYESQHRDGWARVIAGNIQRLLDTMGPFRLADHVPDVYGVTLGSAGTPHVRLAVKQLHKDNVIVNPGIGDNFHRDVIRRLN